MMMLTMMMMGLPIIVCKFASILYLLRTCMDEMDGQYKSTII